MMRLPYVQLAMEVIEQSAPDVAAALDVDEAQAGWGLVRMIRWAIGRCSPDRPPSASAVVTGEAAARQIARAAGWSGDPDAWVDAVASVEPAPLLERTDDGIRIRGLDRYDRHWAKCNPIKAAKWKASQAEPEPNSAETPPEPERNRRKSGAEPEPNSAETPPPDTDTDLLPSEVEKHSSASPPAAEPLELEPLTQPACDEAVGLLRLWNELVGGVLPQARDLNPDRLTKARARLRERPLSEWREVIERMLASGWCTGVRSKGWRASFDFLLRPTTATKVLEGQYDDAGPPVRAPPSELTGIGSSPVGTCEECGAEGSIARWGDRRLCYPCGAKVQFPNGMPEQFEEQDLVEHEAWAQG